MLTNVSLVSTVPPLCRLLGSPVFEGTCTRDFCRGNTPPEGRTGSRCKYCKFKYDIRGGEVYILGNYPQTQIPYVGREVREWAGGGGW